MDANPADQMAGEVKFAPLDSIPPAPPSMSDTGADAGSEAPVNPRKRKKASRAYVCPKVASVTRLYVEKPHTHFPTYRYSCFRIPYLYSSSLLLTHRPLLLPHMRLICTEQKHSR